MNFFKQVLATIVGLTIFQIIGMIMFFVFLGIMMSTFKEVGDSNATVEVEDHSLLVLNLNYEISDKDGFTEFSFDDMQSIPKEKAGLQSMIDAISFAKTDDRVEGIYMDLSIFPNGYATIDALKRALLDFKTSGKFIVAYGEMIDQKSYYLASVADEFYANPEGYIELRGMGARLTFFKRLLEEKLEAEVQVFKVGDYKSAVEPFIKESMSDENREQLEYLLGGIKEDFINTIANNRNISPEGFDEILNNLKGLSPDSCVKYGLLDDVVYFDEILTNLKGKTGIEMSEDLNSIDINDYAFSTATQTNSANKIAVVYAEGSIVDGKGDETSVGGEKFAKIIRKLRGDDDIDAIVLRVNSPGGSALASEVIWRELELAKEVKPVVVSMGNLAASGGYYISCNADKIYAEENTITGSIGVFGMVPNMQKFLNNKIGVTFDDVLLNDHATSNGVTNELSDFEAKVIQQNVDQIYKTFTSRVSEGRSLPIGDVLAVASGRVWTGEQALERGLVDEIGSLNDALAYAAELAELEDYRIRSYPEKKSPFEQFFSDLGMEATQGQIEKELGVLYPYYQEVKNIQEMDGKVQAKMPYLLEIY